MSKHILKELARKINEGDKTFDTLEAETGVARSTLCRLAQGKLPFISIEVVARMAPTLGYELKLVRKRARR